MQPGKLIAQAGLVSLFCAVGASLILLPRILHSPRPREAGPRSEALTEDSVRQALAGIPDPELGLNIVDLGLVRDIRIEAGGEVTVTIVFTSPFCPLADVILSRVRESVSSLEGVRQVRVKVDRGLVWDPQMASEEGRRRLRELLQ